ncbi:MAG TPA: thrombospondin type 3 repeat-containing protein [Herpetosiphonaceae bacterium]
MYRRRNRRLTFLMLVALLVNVGSWTAQTTSTATATTTSSTTILYQNNFESPSIPPGDFCASDFSQTPVNSMYGPGFQQVWTPELMIVNGPKMRYRDPAGIGGRYVLGMLESLQDDKLALTFDSQMRSFINIGIDISAISADKCGVNQLPGVPRFRLSLYDTPSGAFNFNAPGRLLGSIDIAGTAVPQQYVFDWTHHVVPLDASAATNGRVTLMWDVIGGFYAAFDNLVVTASDTAGVVDNDFDGIADDTDLDDDNDGLGDTTETTVGTDPLDADSDNDGVLDGADGAPLDPTSTGSSDVDGDGVADGSDNCPAVSNASQLDTDSDGQGNACDSDDDNDGVLDGDDAFPLNATESVDTDQDGIGNNADTDDDNDGVLDSTDALPLNPAESVDTDQDGIGNNADTDDDGDGVADVADPFPLNPNESLDSDGDGIGNNTDDDDDNDNILDSADAFPLDPNESLDTDRDGTGNNTDDDDDNDNVLDSADAFPLDSNESLDTDGDGTGNNADTDDDDDTLSDADELALGTNPFAADTDDDGLADAQEIAGGTSPLLADSDSDGLTDGQEITSGTDPLSTDTDGDGVSDGDEVALGTSPLLADSDGDGLADGQEITSGTNPLSADSDGDGINDAQDAFPLNGDESLDTDGDGLGNNADTDDDSDNVPDSEDPFPLIRDTTAPSIILAAGSFQLWPPNHQYETITVRSCVLGAADGTDGQLDASDVVITRVSSDELEDAPGGGDGATLQDIVIAADGRSVQLRSERMGSGNGRVYTIDVQVTDRSGNRAVASFQVQVPKSQNGNAAVADTPRYIVSRP